MICLVSDFNMLNYYVEEIPEAAYSILEHATAPTTIIYDKPLRVSENLIAAGQHLGHPYGQRRVLCRITKTI